MDTQERKVIDELFDKLSQAERQGNRPEPMAQAHIRSRIEQQPEAPYLMAQTIVAQEHALGAAQARIAGFEAELARRPAEGGGFLAGLFGGGAGQSDSLRAATNTPAAMQTAAQPAMGNSAHFGRGSPQPQPQPGRGGGFLAGAAQTAMGVAGGVFLGSMLGNAFGGGHGEKAAAAPAPAPASETTASNDSADADGGGDFGGDFGGGEA